MSRRASIGLADQAVSALGNVTLSLAVATSVTTIEFGRFSLVLLLYFTACGVSRALNSEPVVVGNSQNHSSDNRLVHGYAFAGALSAGALASVGLLAAAAVGAQAPDLVVLAALLPLLLLQDAVRVALLVDARPGAALQANDLVDRAQIHQCGNPPRDTAELLSVSSRCGAVPQHSLRCSGCARSPSRLASVVWAMDPLRSAAGNALRHGVCDRRRCPAIGVLGIAGVAGLAIVAAIRGAKVILRALESAPKTSIT